MNNIKIKDKFKNVVNGLVRKQILNYENSNVEDDKIYYIDTYVSILYIGKLHNLSLFIGNDGYVYRRIKRFFIFNSFERIIYYPEFRTLYIELYNAYMSYKDREQINKILGDTNVYKIKG